ncbi:MAG: flagellar hook-length control protein FliK [Lachnospiraceae bacterium]|nr:flagellar hook-length control protein FliK [Lachnospiraceae bacterium]
MEISTNTYNYNVGSVTQTQPSVQITDGADARGQEALRQLENGQTVQGRVMSVTVEANGSRTAQIDLGGGAQVSARLDSAMALTEGTSVTFQVRNTADGQINLSPLYQNTALDSSALRALAQAGMDADQASLQMVREMMSYGLSIDRESLQIMARGMQEFPDANMTTLLQMRGMELPLTENTLTQFQNYQNYQHQIVHSLQDVMNGLPQAFTTMTQTGQAVQALDMYGALIRLFTNPEEAVDTQPYLSAEAADASAAVHADVTSDLPGSPEGQATLLTSDGLEAMLAQMTPEEAENFLAQLNSGMRGEVNASADVAHLAPEIAGENAEALGIGVPERRFSPDGVPLAQESGMQQVAPQAETFAELMKQAGLSRDPAQMSSNELMKALSDLYQQTAHTSPAADQVWTKLFSSEEFSALLKDTMNEQWLLKPEDVSEKGNVDALYQRLKGQTQQLTQLLARTLGEGTPLSQQVATLNGNIDFMNQLNQMFQYVQLPLQMQNGETHGDLYVYTNKKSLARDDGTVSAILHLDMDAMGPLDVYVKMQDRKVNTNFYVADDEVLDLISLHIDELNERLNKRGYSFDCRMMLQSEMTGEDAAVDEMLKKSPGSVGVVSEQSFDARA